MYLSHLVKSCTIFTSGWGGDCCWKKKSPTQYYKPSDSQQHIRLFPSKQLHVSILWLLETTPASVYKALLNGTLTSLVSTDNDFVYINVHTPIDLCNARMAYLSKVSTGISLFLVVQINSSTCSTTFFYLKLCMYQHT